MSQPSPPSAPDPAQSYAQGLQVFLQNLPGMLQKEQGYREQYDPRRIAEQQQLQQTYGPKQYAQQLLALKQLDPIGYALRNELGTAVRSDLASGYSLGNDLDQQLTSQIRGAEAARGNTLGNSAVSAEGLFKGQAAINLRTQRIAEAGSFLSSPTPEQQITAIQPVSPDRSFSYVNPAAGYQGQQFALNNYSNLMGQYSAAGQTNPWASALGGAASGAAAGSAFGPWGTVIGGVVGGGVGYLSDQRLKEKIVFIAETSEGLN